MNKKGGSLLCKTMETLSWPCEYCVFASCRVLVANSTYVQPQCARATEQNDHRRVWTLHFKGEMIQSQLCLGCNCSSPEIKYTVVVTEPKGGKSLRNTVVFCWDTAVRAPVFITAVRAQVPRLQGLCRNYITSGALFVRWAYERKAKMLENVTSSYGRLCF